MKIQKAEAARAGNRREAVSCGRREEQASRGRSCERQESARNRKIQEAEAARTRVARSRNCERRESAERSGGMEFAAEIWGWLMEHLLYINLVLSVVIVFFRGGIPRPSGPG